MSSSGGPATAPDPDAVATELYRVPPEEFVAARDARVAEARAAGDKAAAKRISALKRPTRAAWLTNLLVADAPDDVEGLLALAGTLADAQRSLDGPALRKVSAQRTKLVNALARRAAGLGRGAGHRVDHGLEREVGAVLESALADPGLAEQVRSGRLVRFERHSGFGPVTPDAGGPAGSGSAASTDAAQGTRGSDRTEGADEAGRGAHDQHEQEQQERDRRRRERLVAEAQERLDRARSDADDAAADRDSARERADSAAAERDEARRRVDELAEELERARDTAGDADRAARSAERSASTAARRAREADAALTRAEEKLRAARED